ncbi:MAG: hypothetical protein ACE5EC_10740, partial [Phycisphaerae bacterium]
PGIALAISMVFVAWLATPAQSCEPGKPAAPEPAVITVATEPAPPAVPASPSAPVLVGFPDSLTIKVAPGVVSTSTGIATIAPATPAAVPGMVWAVAGEHEAPPPKSEQAVLEARIERLEHQLARLSEQLERMAGKPSFMSTQSGAGAAYHALRDLQQSQTRSHQEAAKAYAGAGGRGIAPSARVVQGGSSRGVIVRTYKLPKGKLKALSNLMVRSDVPTRVRRLNDGIELHGTLADHIRFKEFVDIITKKGEQNIGYYLPKGKLQALVELMSRDDVPVFIEPATNGKAICVHGDPAVQAIVCAFIDMIHPAEKTHDPISSRGVNRRSPEWFDRDSAAALKEMLARVDVNSARESAEKALQEALIERENALASFTEISKGLLMKELFDRRALLQECRARSNSLEREAERLEETADRLEEQADQLHNQAEELREKASESENPERASELREEAESLAERALELEQASRENRSESEAIERDMNRVNEVVEELEALLEKLDKRAEASAR